MSDPIIPLLGAKGTYVAASPFDTLVNANQQFTCIGIRNLSDYITNNEDPLTSVYKKATNDTNLQNTLYAKGVRDNVVILTLQSDHGFIVNLPCDYLISYPNLNGVPYAQKGIAIQLPAMPDNVDYAAFVTDLKEYIKGALGVDCAVVIANTSTPAAVSQTQHEATQAARRVAAADKGSLLLQVLRLQSELDAVVAQRDALESVLS